MTGTDALLDRTRPVRSGEELDVAALEKFLRGEVSELSQTTRGFAIEQFPGGHSNLTYLLRAGEREYVLRRPPFGARAIKAGHDMAREHRILTQLHGAGVRVPRPIYLCDESRSPIGAQFYLMERVHGVILRATSARTASFEESTMHSLSRAAVEALASLHSVDVRASGLADLGRPEGYLRRQVDGWTARYNASRTDDVPGIDAVMKWLDANVPAGQDGTLIHNDFKYDNLVLDRNNLSNVLAILDWEMATIGDPLSDLGMTLAYWIEPADPEPFRMMGLGLTTLPGNLDREGVVKHYEHVTGRAVGPMTFYFALGLFKIAVIAQQIYYRYKQGFTADERFARFIMGVMLFAQAAERAIETGSLAASAREAINIG